MKRLLFFLLPLMGMLLHSCTKDVLSPDQADIDALKAAKNGNVFIVEPSGTDDTGAIIQAFEDAKAAGHGSVVKLVEGEYKIGFIEVNDFYGTFRGAGKDKTFVGPIPDLPCDVISDVENELPSLMKFFGGDIHMTRMSFRMPDGNLCDEDQYYATEWEDLFCMVLFGGYSEDEIDESTDPETLENEIDVLVDHCGFFGGNDLGTGTDGLEYNVTLGIWMGPDFYWPDPYEYPRSKGNFAVEYCDFDFILAAVEGGFCKDATMDLKGNSLADCFMTFYFTANLECEVHITQNLFSNSGLVDVYIDDQDWGLIVDDPPSGDHTYYHVTKNVFSQITGFCNIWIQEDRMVQRPDEEYPMIVQIQQNKFNLSEGMFGIKGENMMQSNIQDNIFTGNGLYGIYLDGEEVFNKLYLTSEGTGTVSEVSLLRNNMQHLNSSEVDIYLGELTSDCYLLGNANMGDVMDDGTDNTIVDLTQKKGNPWGLANQKQQLTNLISTGRKMAIRAGQ